MRIAEAGTSIGIADVPPLPEGAVAAAGAMPMASAADHIHASTSSRVYAQLGADNTVTVAFGKTYDNEPFPIVTYREAGAANQPLWIFVDSWVMTNGKYTGAIIRAKRSVKLPAVLTLLSALVNYDIAAGSAQGVPIYAVFLKQL